MVLGIFKPSEPYEEHDEIHDDCPGEDQVEGRRLHPVGIYLNLERVIEGEWRAN